MLGVGTLSRGLGAWKTFQGIALGIIPQKTLVHIYRAFLAVFEHDIFTYLELAT